MPFTKHGRKRQADNGESSKDADDTVRGDEGEGIAEMEGQVADTFVKLEVGAESSDGESINASRGNNEPTILLPAWQKNELGSPPFETPSIGDIITNFLTYKYHGESRVVMKCVANVFLSALDDLEWPSVDDYEKESPYPVPDYSQHYDRWTHFREDHLPREMFGANVLRILYKYITDAMQKNRDTYHPTMPDDIPADQIFSKIPAFCSDLDKTLSDVHSAIFSSDFVYSSSEDDDTEDNNNEEDHVGDIDVTMKTDADSINHQIEEALFISPDLPVPSKETIDLFHVLCPPPSVPRRDERARQEEREGLIEFLAVQNDGSHDSWIIRTALKNIFQRQLPMMPKEYITRLVYDHGHASMAVVKRLSSGFPHVVGGITYRVFEETRVIEIVFCAITASEQVKGYGSLLMSHLKDHLLQGKQSPAEFDYYMMTYADNYAIGYFKKQGFTREISLDRKRWQGYIKDYDGGTLMQCKLIREIAYLDIHQTVRRQRLAVVARLQFYHQYNQAVVHPGLKSFPVSDPMSIPAVKEAGWTNEMRASTRTVVPQNALHRILRQLLNEAISHPASWPFQDPVNGEEVPDYYAVIQYPMDLKTMEEKLDRNEYRTMSSFEYDIKKIFDNCKIYNTPDTVYHKCALKLEAWFSPRSAVLKGLLASHEL